MCSDFYNVGNLKETAPKGPNIKYTKFGGEGVYFQLKESTSCCLLFVFKLKGFLEEVLF